MGKSRTQKSELNIVVGVATKMVTLLLTFVGRKIFINNIGIEYLGINGLFSNVLSLLSMADLGFGTAISYSFYEPLAKKDEKRIAALMNFYSKIYNLIAAAVAVVGIAIVPFLKYIVNMEQGIQHLYFYYLLFLSNTVVSYLFIYKSTLINADQKGYVVNGITAICNIIKTVLQIISVYFLKSYTIYLLVMIVSTFINNLIISNYVDRNYSVLKTTVNLEKEDTKEIFGNIKSMFIYKVSSTLISSVDSILISVILGTVIVGYYSNYQTIIVNITAFVTILFSSVTASIGNLVVTGNKKSRYKVFRTMQMVSFWISGTISVCIYILANDFVALWLGKEYILPSATVFAMALSFFFSCSMQPLWSFREATGLYRKTKYIMLLAAIENLILSWILGEIYGLSGIILATVIARVTTYFWYEPYLLFRECFGISEKRYFFDYMINVIIMVITMIVVKKISSYIACEGWIYWLIKAGSVVIIISCIYAIKYVPSSEFKYLTNKILRKEN